MAFMEKENTFVKMYAKWLDKAGTIHLEDGSKQMCRLKQTCRPTGGARKFLTTITDVFLLNCALSLDEARDGDIWSLSHLGYLYPGTTPVMIKLDHNRSCPWAQIAQVTNPTIITKVPRSVPGSTQVITHRGVFRLPAGVHK